MGRYLLGYDVGSSSIKASLLEIESGSAVAGAVSPKRELAIQAPRPGWAEQDPEVWWEHVTRATAELGSQAELAEVDAVGISYQMHGLVCLDREGRVLRPAIIWCDSRAVAIGEAAFAELGPQACLKRLLNSPGNFTASKLKWVKDNEPELFGRIHRICLPGDYIAYRLTGELLTTPSGLSEGILWDFQEDGLARFLLQYYGLPEALVPPLVDSFSEQGRLSRGAAEALGLRPGVPVAYRAGDQPNNALSLNVLNPGEVAATAGTSGVVYGVGSEPRFDHLSRVNTFVHVNHKKGLPRYGTLLCLNGTAILNSWLRHNVMSSGEQGASYEQMDALAARVPVGSEGLCVLPFGNGAERTLENRNLGASIHGLDFNRHRQEHLLRAAQEGIVFALAYGLRIMEGMGLRVEKVRAGAGNMFRSPVFAGAFATLTGASLELYSTDGAQGAARGAAIGAKIRDLKGAFDGLEAVRVLEPDRTVEQAYQEAYSGWLAVLQKQLAAQPL
jgi:xylulokinase